MNEPQPNVHRLFGLVFLSLSLCALPQKSYAQDYLDPMPSTHACSVMRDDINPNMESDQNRNDLEYLFKGTVQQGKNGQQCNIFRSERGRLQNDSALNLSGISKYSRERVFAWGRLCLLDWCDGSGATPGTDHTNNGGTPNNNTPLNNGGPHGPPPAPRPPGADKSKPWFTFVVCNRSGDGPMRVAVDVENHSNERTKVVRGWWTVNDGDCHAIVERDFGDWSSMEILVHAHTKNYVWPAKQEIWTQLCISDRSPYERTDTRPHTCRPDERLRPFWRTVVNKTDPHHTTSTVNIGRHQ
jgi:hypothetical protein